jgi:hypothetical protein
LGTTSFACLPLWRDHYDDIAGLDFSADKPPYNLAFGGWTQAVGKQYQELCNNLAAGCSIAAELSASGTPSMDLDVFAGLSIFTPPVWNGNALVQSSCAANPSGCIPQDVTSSVSVERGGFRYNFGSHYWEQAVTVTNNSGTSIPAPVSLAFDAVSASVASGSGITSCTYPAPTPYVTVSSEPLLPVPPGLPVKVLVQFTSNSPGIQYATRVLSGNGVL